MPILVSGTPGFTVKGFASSTLNPFLPNPGKNAERAFNFAGDRLVDTDGDGFPEYLPSLGGPPLAYFSAYDGSGYDPDDCDLAGEDLGAFQTYNALTSAGSLTGTGPVAGRPDLLASPGPNPYTSGPAAPATGQALYQNPNTYQLICAGYDFRFGIGGEYSASGKLGTLPFDASASAAVTGMSYDAGVRTPEPDNLTNFHDGQLGR